MPRITFVIVPVMACFFGACATMQMRRPEVSILVDLDPASAGRTVIVESITADREGRIYLPDRVSGNILRVDPKSPKPAVISRIEAREIKGKRSMPTAGAALSTRRAISSNMDANGKTSLDGIGASSIAQITP